MYWVVQITKGKWKEGEEGRGEEKGREEGRGEERGKGGRKGEERGGEGRRETWENKKEKRVKGRREKGRGK